MKKLYFNEYHQIALYIDESDKTYKIYRGKLKHVLKACFYYKASVDRIKEVYRNVKRTYSMA